MQRHGLLPRLRGTGENSLRRDTYYGDGVYRVQLGIGEFPAWSWARLDTAKQFHYGNTAALVRDGNELFVALSAGNTTTPLYASVRAPEPAAGYGVHRRDGSGTGRVFFDTTSNGAERWADLLLPTDLVKLPGRRTRFLLGVMNDGIFRTDDRGQTWCALNPGSARAAAPQTSIATPTSPTAARQRPAGGRHVRPRGDRGRPRRLLRHPRQLPSGYTEATQGGDQPLPHAYRDNQKPWVFKSSGERRDGFGRSAGRGPGALQPLYPCRCGGRLHSSALGRSRAALLQTHGSLAVTRLRRTRCTSTCTTWAPGEPGTRAAGCSTPPPTAASTSGRRPQRWIAGNDSLITTAFVDIGLD